MAYKPPLLELLLGAAALLAEYNGIERAGHVRDARATLAMYVETVRGLTKAVRRLQDIAGGLVVTGPMEDDWLNPQTRPDLEAVLVGSARAGAEARLRAFNLVRDLTASDFGGYLEVLAIHAEGSLEAQKLAILTDTDLEPYKAYARRLAGIGCARL